MKTHHVITHTMTALLLMSCASSPDKMTAADVSPLQYRHYDCDQIAAESDRIGRKVTALYDNLKKKADNDEWQMGVGLILLWPVLFALEGGDGPDATEYKQLKGEYDALQEASIQKKCSIQFEDLDAKLKAKAAADKAKAEAEKNKYDNY